MCGGISQRIAIASAFHQVGAHDVLLPGGASRAGISGCRSIVFICIDRGVIRLVSVLERIIRRRSWYPRGYMDAVDNARQTVRCRFFFTIPRPDWPNSWHRLRILFQGCKAHRSCVVSGYPVVSADSTRTLRRRLVGRSFCSLPG